MSSEPFAEQARQEFVKWMELQGVTESGSTHFEWLIWEFAFEAGRKSAAPTPERCQECTRLNAALQERDKCAYMGPMRDCPTHGDRFTPERLEQAARQIAELGPGGLRKERVLAILQSILGGAEKKEG